MFKRFIFFIKRFFYKEIVFNDDLETESINELFERINVGDIYYAQMPLPKEALLRIEPSHRIRPYVIVSKDNHRIYAYQCSSKVMYKLKNHEYSELFETSKKSYVYLNKVYELPIENFVSYITNLSQKSKQNIDKRLVIASNHDHILPRFNVDFKLDIGDIFVVDRQLYYIYQRDNTLLYTHKVHKNQSIQNEKLIRITVNNQDLYISYLKQQQFNAKEKYRIMYNLTSEQQKYIKITKADRKRKKKAIKNKQAPATFKIQYALGQVISNIEGNFVYLYSIDNKKYGVLFEELYDDIPRLIRIRNNHLLSHQDNVSITDLLNLTNRFIDYNINPHGVFKQYHKHLSNLKNEATTH